ncbi:hypothetical protein VSDG_08423 [Cytospora chrysosperma]|uniref:Ketoreductase (KR) domain-containing protein n=1 Tax=Cytospora chrysosperma TaxID=252740 RepID=A0A423VHH8_CYTCH|nr:hypothetical protein VSDG_08423 [Valsa sordida]
MMINNSMVLDTERDVPLLTDRVITITREEPQATTVERLAQGTSAYLLGAETVINRIHGIVPDADLTFVQLDQADLASDHGHMAKAKTATRSSLPSTTSAHALIIKKLLTTHPPANGRAARRRRSCRVPELAGLARPLSGGIRSGTLKTGQDFGFNGPWRGYGHSKVVNIVGAAELARRYLQVTAVSIHPEVLRTDLVQSKPFMPKAVMVLSVEARVSR